MTVVVDAFPAEIVLPGQAKVAGRVVIDGGVVRVYAARGHTPFLAFEGELTEPYVPAGGRRAQQTARTALGDVRWVRSGGCGCGNPLRRADPATLADVRDPYFTD